MRKTYRHLLSVLLFSAAVAVVAGCGDSGGIAPKSNSDVKLKPLPTPGSPAEGGGNQKAKDKAGATAGAQ